MLYLVNSALNTLCSFRFTCMKFAINVSDSVYRDADIPEHTQTERISRIPCCIRLAEQKHQWKEQLHSFLKYSMIQETTQKQTDSKGQEEQSATRKCYPVERTEEWQMRQEEKWREENSQDKTRRKY